MPRQTYLSQHLKCTNEHSGIQYCRLSQPHLLYSNPGPQRRGGEGNWQQSCPLKFSELLFILLFDPPTPLKYFCPTMLGFLYSYGADLVTVSS